MTSDGAHPRSLTDQLDELLMSGVTAGDLVAVRQRLGHDADPEAVIRALQRRQPRLPGVGATPPATPTVTVGAASSRTAAAAAAPDRLLVMGEGLPSRLQQTWGQGGPLWLHHRGQDLGEGPHVAVVGTRRATMDGLAIAERLGHDLARAGIAVVSGMARGIDQAAHRGALAAGGCTVGVLGTGLDVDYPAGSAALRRSVTLSGCLVSEYAAGHGIRLPAQFIARNRILVGLCDAVVVVEAGARSGALNSATWAAQYNRDVVVVPFSPSNRMAAGSLELLRDGAIPVRDADDVLELLGLPTHPGALGISAGWDATAPARPTGPAGRILPLLGPTACSPSGLAGATGLTPREVLVGLSELEELGLARRTPAGVIRAG